MFIAPKIGSAILLDHIKTLLDNGRETDLRRVVCLDETSYYKIDKGIECQSYASFISNGLSIFMNDAVLKRAERQVVPSDVLNLQFTSGKFQGRGHF